MTLAPRPSLERIAEARSAIDPVFLDTPQFRADRLSDALGADVIVKVECVNPIRSFKGRGAEYFTHRNKDSAPRPWVCASAGNFGQGLAYAARKHDIPLTVFAAKTANPFKVSRMRELGAEVRLVGDDFDASKEACRAFALERGLTYIEDGRDPSITEGAGTLAIELAQWPEPLDVVFVPVGNGALINGVGLWLKSHHPRTRVIGVGTERVPAMALSFREQKVVVLQDTVSTVADGVAARVPVPEAVSLMLEVVDDMLLVPEDAIVDAMRKIQSELGLIVEGAGAVTLAAAAVYAERFRETRIALVISGSNVSGG